MSNLPILCHKHSPTAILLSTLNVLLGNQLFQQFLYSRHTDACFLFLGRQRQSRLCSHSIQNLRIVGCSESNSLSATPPYIFISLTHKQHIIINISSHQVIETFQERTDILNIRMGTITGNRTYLKICLMQSFQILTLFATTNHNHRIVVAS